MLHKTGSGPSLTTSAPKKGSQARRRRRDHDNDSDSEGRVNDHPSSDPSKPWLEEWNLYLQTHEVVPEGLGIVEWWGVCVFG